MSRIFLCLGHLLLNLSAILGEFVVNDLCLEEGPKVTTVDCGCRSNRCDEDGQCDGTCKRGRFGVGCLYEDVIKEGILTLVPDQKSAWVADGDKKTCNKDKGLESVTVTWMLSNEITWIRLHVKDTYELKDVDIHQTNPSGIVFDCEDRRMAFTELNTVDIYCNSSERTARIEFTGEVIPSLCGILISGGRNVALHGAAKQTTTLAEMFAAYAVDGDTNTVLESKKQSCSHSQEESNPVWQLELKMPSLVNRFFVYSRRGYELRSLQFHLITYTEDNKIHYDFTFNDNCGVFKGTTTHRNMLVSRAKIALPEQLISIERILTICELQLYGDVLCPVGKFGIKCEKSCHCADEEACFVNTGVCPTGCAPGWYGVGCDIECPLGDDGQRDCQINCTGFCLPSPKGPQYPMCSFATGACYHGCVIGYGPAPGCTEACRFGTYGWGCNFTCSEFCYTVGQNYQGRPCDAVTGECAQGCKAGYELPNCFTVCPTDTYGVNCTEQCSDFCNVDSTGSGNSKCMHTTGVCIYGCMVGYVPPYCQTACPWGTYGQDCKQTCSKTCNVNPNGIEDSMCNHKTGACDHGCMVGYQPRNCHDACPSGKYGQDCMQACSEFCNTDTTGSGNSVCNHINGSCAYGCAVGYRPPKCHSACPWGTYGQDCRQTCSKNCNANPDGPADAMCSHSTGACLHGCMVGFQPPRCQDTCFTGTFGQDCQQSCSMSCNANPDGTEDDICYPQTGACLHGCMTGYQPPTCLATCSSGTYGQDCQLNCSESCAANPYDTREAICSHSTGDCLHGCIPGYHTPKCQAACPSGTYGQNCKQSCSKFCNTNPDDSDDSMCNHITGVCLFGCMGGYQPPNCITACPSGTYGRNCKQTCSPSCNTNPDGAEDSKCNPGTGACLHGCIAGYQPPNCQAACSAGTFGQDCKEKCSNFCHANVDGSGDMICNHSTGACLHGCTTGYQPPNCKSACSKGQYGLNCTNRCPQNCRDRECNIEDGECECVPGHYGKQCVETCADGCSNDTCAKEYGLCDCEKGYHGETCAERCSENCQGGDCDKTNGECISACANGYYGVNCTEPCPESCKDGKCKQENGVCNSGCENGYYGINCTHICLPNCKDGKCNQTDGECTCENGYYGAYCSEPCPENCKDGECHTNKGVCNSGCEKGYYEINCTHICPPNCEDGECNQTNGECDCAVGFHGELCEFSCPDNCQRGACDRSDGFCDCEKGYHGESCTERCPDNCEAEECDKMNGECSRGCKNEFYGATCNETCLGICEYGQCDRISGVCPGACLKGYHGTNCTEPCPGNCKDGECNREDGVCNSSCEDTYYGIHCAQICPRNCKDGNCKKENGICDNACENGFHGIHCTRRCPPNCKGGKCEQVNGECSCKNGYFGESCRQRCPFHCMDGKCDQLTGDCDCDEGFYGEHCQFPCPDNCLLGTCNRSDGFCECKEGYFGARCMETCPILCPPKNCNQETGRCECPSGYYGLKCDRQCSQFCVEVDCNMFDGDCSGCVEGYYGMKCTETCPPFCENEFCDQLTGDCDVCIPGHFGRQCQETCGDGCTNNTCAKEYGLCDCYDGYYGLTCIHPCSGLCENETCNKLNGECDKTTPLPLIMQQEGESPAAPAINVTVTILFIIVAIGFLLLSRTSDDQTPEPTEEDNEFNSSDLLEAAVTSPDYTVTRTSFYHITSMFMTGREGTGVDGASVDDRGVSRKTSDAWNSPAKGSGESVRSLDESDNSSTESHKSEEKNPVYVNENKPGLMLRNSS